MALIAEAHEVAAEEGEMLWPGFASAPFQIVLIDGDYEYLICPEGPAQAFEPVGEDPVTSCLIKRRASTFAPAMLASFPAVDGISTIVMGTPEATGLTPERWRQIVLHEHFHQYQTTAEAYYQAALDLDLHGGDQTGMWMLNYPFPYDDPAAGAAARALADAALAALDAEPEQFDAAFASYAEARSAFLASISEADARYYEMQVWNEGLARWTEIELARLSARRAGFEAVAEALERELREELASLDLAAQRRVAFYPLGAAEGEILTRAGVDWRSSYLTRLFQVQPYFDSSL